MGIFHGHQCIVYLCIPITDYKGYKSQFWKLHQVHSRTREKIFMILQDLSLGAISCSLTGCFGTLPPDFLFPTIGILCRFTLSCLQGVILTLEGIPGTNESCLNVPSFARKCWDWKKQLTNFSPYRQFTSSASSPCTFGSVFIGTTVSVDQAEFLTDPIETDAEQDDAASVTGDDQWPSSSQIHTHSHLYHHHHYLYYICNMSRMCIYLYIPTLPFANDRHCI